MYCLVNYRTDESNMFNTYLIVTTHFIHFVQLSLQITHNCKKNAENEITNGQWQNGDTQYHKTLLSSTHVHCLSELRSLNSHETYKT